MNKNISPRCFLQMSALTAIFKGGQKRKNKLISTALVIATVVSLFATTVPVTAPAAAAGSPVTASVQAQADPPTPIYLDPSYSFEERAADLVSRMTLAEKASQMISNMAPAIPRLGIPAYGWWNEALHGVSSITTGSGNAGPYVNTTSYPIDQAIASSWDPELLYREASMISDEAREVTPQNRLNLDFYSPTVNLGRDARWGRNDESYGEDPYLAAAMAAQFVNGMQGQDMNGNLLPEGGGYLKTVTTLKHYAANNSEVNRLNGTATFDERSSREYYTNVYRRIVQLAHPGSVMSSYNSISVTPYQSYKWPAAASVYLMDTLMRQTFGFNGYFTSDCDAIYTISASNRQNWVPPGWTRTINQIERSAWALTAGEDLECNAGYNDGVNYRTTLPTAVSQNLTTPTGLFTENDMDTALVRLFTARMKLGEFDDPNLVPWVAQARARVPSWVNSNSNLAITETPERLAMARESGDKSIVLLKNSDTTKKDGSTGKLLPLQVPATGDFTVDVIGYFANPNSIFLGGYSSSQQSNGVANEVNGYNGLKNAILAINPSAVVTYTKGFTDTSTSASGLVHVDPNAVNNAANYDYVVVYVGADGGTAAEDRDRTSLSLPGSQASLISQVAAKNPNTIVYIEATGEMDVTPFEPSISALLYSSYNGMRKGEALADVILGNYNPSGRTPTIWYPGNGTDTSMIPPITDYTLRPSTTITGTLIPGRTYMYYTGTVAYPFGYGLSYTTFGYSNLQIDNKTLDANSTFHVSADVTNTGAVSGAEVVELYVNTPDAAPALQRPIKRLEGFQKVTLNPGETKTVTFAIKVPDLAFFDNDLNKWVVDNGRYGIQISKSSADADIQLQDYVQVTGALTPKLSLVTVKPTQEGDAAMDIPTRVIFGEGRVVIPQLTVAMSDDTLYGYIVKGNSQSFPAGMTFQYSSNRPEVVSVDGNGVIRTVSSGAATVTVTATYEGVSKSANFVVRVVADVSLSGIKVNGKPISTFSPDVLSYSLIVPDGVTTVPQVEATATNPAATVEINQATAVPGQAAITVTKGYDQAVYTIDLGFKSVSDEFDSDTLGPQWTWIREDPTNWSLTGTPGSLVITPQQGDLQTTNNTARNILVQDAVGDWTIESKLVFSITPHVNYQQGGIIAYQDDDNYVKLGWERYSNFSGTRFVVLNENGGTAATPFSVSANNIVTTTGTNANTVWFRMEKSGANYSTYYSVDGDNFTLIGTTTAALSNVKVGLYAFNRTGTSTDLNVAFDYFHVTNTSEVANVAPAVSADLAAQNVQYTDAIQAVTLAATDLAGDLPLSATTQWSLNGGTFQSGLPSWLTLTPVPCASDDLNATCTWTLQGTAPVQAGTFIVRTTVSDKWLVSNATDVTIVVTPEDAAIQYTGEVIAPIKTNLTLRATVWDSAASGFPGSNPEIGPGKTIGDITKMWIEFDIYPSETCLSGTPTTKTVRVSDTGTVGDGIGTASATLTSKSEAAYCVVARLVAGQSGGDNPWYTAEDAPVAGATFYENSGKFAIGSGTIDDPGGGKGFFSFNARYDKRGRPYGPLTYVYTGTYQSQPANYTLICNTGQGLQIVGTSYPLSANLQGSCLIFVFGQRRPGRWFSLLSISMGKFQAAVLDSGTASGSGPDSFSMTAYDRNGVPIKSIPATPVQMGQVLIRLK